MNNIWTTGDGTSDEPFLIWVLLDGEVILWSDDEEKDRALAHNLLILVLAILEVLLGVRL